MKIELLYFEGCPHYGPAGERVEKILLQEGIEAEVIRVSMESEAMAMDWKFPGSPTVRVDGKDIEENAGGPQEDFRLSCRVYQEQGKTTGIPPESLIRQAFRHSK